MITSSAFAAKQYAVLGLARSGLAAAEALVASGAQVLAWDRQDVAREKMAGKAQICDPMEADLTGYAGVVVSPGVPLNTHPISAHAQKYGVPVIGDIELFAQARPSLPKHRLVAITGTNGKSTTTALIAHILDQAGVPVRMGGNIGLPIMGEEPLGEGGVYVLELSSYQIDLTYSLDCDLAVLLNITPDHLDRYDGFDGYVASKMRLFEMLQTGLAVIPEGQELLDRLSSELREERPDLKICWHDLGKDGEQAKGGQDKDGQGGDPADENASAATRYSQRNWPSLQGPHNRQNAEAAITVCEALGLEPHQIEAGLASYKGLPHRMELVAQHKGVTFINDSKATNQASTAPALAAYPPDPTPRIRWIVGGLAKEDGLGECADYLGNVAKAYTIGDAGPRFGELLAGQVPVASCELLQAATSQAASEAQSGDIILFSPACASFDQFRDYEKRGEHFRQIIQAQIAEPLPEARLPESSLTEGQAQSNTEKQSLAEDPAKGGLAKDEGRKRPDIGKSAA